MYWPKKIDWSTPAGETLVRLVEALPEGRNWSLTAFGLPLLELGFGTSFPDTAINIFGREEDHESLLECIARIGWRTNEREVFINPCFIQNFRTSPAWWERSRIVRWENVELRIPQPIDILIARLHCLGPREIKVFRKIIRQTGHPTAWEMRRELGPAIDLFRPNFEDEPPNKTKSNTRRLFLELWDDKIDVHQEIILPTLELLRKCVEPDLARRNCKTDLRGLDREFPSSP